MSETAALLPRPASAPQEDSHSIFLRACHSPWRLVNQRVLTAVRLLISGYLISVAGVSLKYKLETEDDHSRWRIIFQFSTVSFVLLLAYHLQVTVWTIMHLTMPDQGEENQGDCQRHRLRTAILNAMSPSTNSHHHNRKFWFSMFYTTAHVFTLMNTIIFWAVLVPAGHGGFKPPELPYHRHPPGNATVMDDPEKGLFDEDDIKAFSIINVWSITSVIALIEIMFLNSIRRQTPVAGHVAGIMSASGAYLAWAWFGKLVTGHSGLFFLDPDLIGNVREATIAASFAFVTLSPGIFSYVYGLIAMRETMTAHQESSG